MLRLAVIVLLLANAGYYAWSQGLLRPLGYAPQEQSEPQRMNQQIRPETLQILKVNPSKTSSAAPPGSTSTPTPTPTPTTPDSLLFSSFIFFKSNRKIGILREFK